MKRALVVLITLFMVVGGFILFMHPYLAVTAPIECNVAVVEGWIPEQMMPLVSAELEERSYATIYTTGTVRPFSYYLKNGEALVLDFQDGIQGGLAVNVSGIAGAGVNVIADGDTLLDRYVTGTAQAYFASPRGTVSQLQLISKNSGDPSVDMDNIYVKWLTIGGANVHSTLERVEFVRTDGSRTSGWPTYAHLAAAILEADGIPRNKIIVAPASNRVDSRTMANAAGFAQRARTDGVDRFDVISVGIHARRSRNMYRKAMGKEAQVGVLAIPDPRATGSNWWRSAYGWRRMLKELAGLPASSIFIEE